MSQYLWIFCLLNLIDVDGVGVTYQLVIKRRDERSKLVSRLMLRPLTLFLQLCDDIKWTASLAHHFFSSLFTSLFYYTNSSRQRSSLSNAYMHALPLSLFQKPAHTVMDAGQKDRRDGRVSHIRVCEIACCMHLARVGRIFQCVSSSLCVCVWRRRPDCKQTVFRFAEELQDSSSEPLCLFCFREHLISASPPAALKELTTFPFLHLLLISWFSLVS